MKKNKLRVAIVTNVIPSYRSDFYKRIFSNKNFDVKVFCQKYIPGMALDTAHEKFKNHVKLVKFISMNKEKIAWQFFPVIRLYKDYDIIIFNGNPRVLSNVFYSILLKVLGKKIIIWGQAHAAGANSLTEKLRLSWWRLFKYIFLYTDKEVSYLKNRGFQRQKMMGMNNGLDLGEIDKIKSEWTPEKINDWKNNQGLTNKVVLLSCARLGSKNRFELMIPVLKQLIITHPQLFWCVIGQGEQEGYLQSLVKNEGLEDHVRFCGAIFDDKELSPWFLSSTALIHPGVIGLSLIHAFSYGLPVITHGSLDNHGPEIVALKDGVNGLLFDEGDHVSMLEVIPQLIFSKPKLIEFKQAAYETVKNEFNTKVMADRFSLFLTT